METPGGAGQLRRRDRQSVPSLVLPAQFGWSPGLRGGVLEGDPEVVGRAGTTRWAGPRWSGPWGAAVARELAGEGARPFRCIVRAVRHIFS